MNRGYSLEFVQIILVKCMLTGDLRRTRTEIRHRRGACRFIFDVLQTFHPALQHPFTLLFVGTRWSLELLMVKNLKATVGHGFVLQSESLILSHEQGMRQNLSIPLSH